jgi:ABC-type Mn2+/Zn2+ transport system ATPase subunit
VSTHDLDLAATRFDRVLLLNRRVIGYGRPQEVFTAERLVQAFGGQAMFIDGMVVIDQCCPGPGEEAPAADEGASSRPTG